MELKEKQKQEAIKRMKMLRIMPQVINDFEAKGTVYYSERQSAIFNATLYWVSNSERFTQIVKDFETKHNALVYHCQLTHLSYGDCLTLLFVSKYEEEWEADKELLKCGEAVAYVENLDDSTCSEMGYVGIKPSLGGVLRTA